jgi:hypothetical protein
MDSERFDSLVRTFSQARSRRQTLRGLAGAAGLLALGTRAAGAQECKANGKACKKNSQCCSGNCVGGTGGGSTGQSGGTCQAANECTGLADGTPCGGEGSGLRCCNGACPSPTCLSVTGTGEGACCADVADCAAKCCTGLTAGGCIGCGPGFCCAAQDPSGGPCGRDADCRRGGACVCGTCPPVA